MSYHQLRFTEAIAMVGILLIVWSMYRAQRDKRFKEFDVFDLLMEHGRLSKVACVFLGSFLATTWIIVRLTIDGKLTEGYFGAYGAMWVAPIVAKLIGPTERPREDPHPAA